MVKQLLALIMLVTFVSVKTHATQNSIGLIVPYKIECVKQPDGTEQIRMSVLLRKAKKTLTLDGVEQTFVANQNAATHVLQSKDGCDVLDKLFSQNGKLYGYDALKVGEDLKNAAFTVTEVGSVFGTLCAYLIRLDLCCGKSTFDAVKDIVFVDKEDEIEWVDLGSITTNGTLSTALSSAQYVADGILTVNLFAIDIPQTPSIEKISIAKKILSTAVLNFHGKPCCFQTFGLKEEDAQGVILQIIKSLERTPGEFMATGTWGSCGDSQKIKVTGNRTKTEKINICGKTYCLLDDLSVASSGDQIQSFPITAILGTLTARCFARFLMSYYSFRFAATDLSQPPFATYGLQDEICRLVKGDDNQYSTFTAHYQLKLFCVDEETGTYDFAFTETDNEGDLFTRVRLIGCRFRLVECPKCCN